MYDLLLPDFELLATVQNPDLIPEGIRFIKADTFWSFGRYGENRVIAVIDTGCDITHPDLADRIAGVRNFTTDDKGDPNNVTDYVGHGTHCAGIIAANLNMSGIIGVAPKAKLLILKALTNSGGSYTWLVNAINYAISKKVDVISMSLGGPSKSATLEAAINKAVQNNISVVCAAGNSGDGSDKTTEIDYPAGYNECISVGSLSLSNTASRFTNTNNQVDLLAPGEGANNSGIYSAAPGGKYALMRGTSMACPHAAGAIALIKNWALDNYKRELTEEEIYAQLIKMTQTMGLPKSIEGSGVINLVPR